ncbi:hypothetical protein HQQ80_08305 [Microbacteriaceae bacterium VKM Ac-2855]|nr:hypothetical protein [Microbacteriaceae bacterium VKM Ac-2855]
MNAGERWETETWLRAAGFPFLVRARSRARNLVSRMAPVLAFFVVANVGSWTVDVTQESVGAIVTFAIFALVLIVAPFVAWILVSRLLARRRARLWWLGWVLLAYAVLVDPLYGGIGPETISGAYLGNLITMVLLAVATWLGLGSILGWAARAALRQLSAFGALTSRALPLLMLVVVFAYFSQETWQLTDALTAAGLGSVALLFVALGLFSLARVAMAELRELDQRIPDDERRRLIAASTLPALAQSAASAGPRLGRLERLNTNLVLIGAQGIQVVFFGAIVWIVLVLLGEIAITDGVLQTWTGHPPVDLAIGLGTNDDGSAAVLTLPVNRSVAHAAFFLSVIAGFNFVISTVTDQSYKNAFYDPLLEQIRIALAVRAVYLSQTERGAPETPEWDLPEPPRHAG